MKLCACGCGKVGVKMGYKRENCMECNKVLTKEDQPRFYTLCKECRLNLHKSIDRLNRDITICLK